MATTAARELELLLGETGDRATRLPQPSASLDPTDSLDLPEPTAPHADQFEEPLGFLDGEVLCAKDCKASGMPPSEYLGRKGVMLTELGRATLGLLNGSERSRLVARAHALGITDARIKEIEEAAKDHKVMGKPLTDPLEALRGEIAMYEAAQFHSSRRGASGAGGNVRGL